MIEPIEKSCVLDKESSTSNDDEWNSSVEIKNSDYDRSFSLSVRRQKGVRASVLVKGKWSEMIQWRDRTRRTHPLKQDNYRIDFTKMMEPIKEWNLRWGIVFWMNGVTIYLAPFYAINEPYMSAWIDHCQIYAVWGNVFRSTAGFTWVRRSFFVQSGWKYKSWSHQETSANIQRPTYWLKSWKKERTWKLGSGICYKMFWSAN